MTRKKELLDLLDYLFFKYLDKEKAKSLLSEYSEAQQSGRNIGKHCLHILTSENIREIELEDKEKLKDAAFLLGI